MADEAPTGQEALNLIFNNIVLFDLANTPIINLAKVPEFPASIIVLFFNEKPLRPTPLFGKNFFF